MGLWESERSRMGQAAVEEGRMARRGTSGSWTEATGGGMGGKISERRDARAATGV